MVPQWRRQPWQYFASFYSAVLVACGSSNDPSHSPRLSLEAPTAIPDPVPQNGTVTVTAVAAATNTTVDSIVGAFLAQRIAQYSDQYSATFQVTSGGPLEVTAFAAGTAPVERTLTIRMQSVEVTAASLSPRHSSPGDSLHLQVSARAINTTVDSVTATYSGQHRSTSGAVLSTFIEVSLPDTLWVRAYGTGALPAELALPILPQTPIARINIAPRDTTVTRLGTFTFALHLLDSLGQELLDPRVRKWQSSDTTVVAVEPSTGVASARGVGAATIRVTVQGHTDSTTVVAIWEPTLLYPAQYSVTPPCTRLAVTSVGAQTWQSLLSGCTSVSEPLAIAAPSWSPDRSSAVFVWYSGGSADLYITSRSGFPPKQLTHDHAYEYWPAWSPDGSRIAFVREDDLTHEFALYLIDTTGSNEHPIPQAPANPAFPAWSPDASLLAFQIHDIFLIPPTGGQPIPLGVDSLFPQGPVFSPDGKSITFVAAAQGQGNSRLFTIPVQGGAPSEILISGPFGQPTFFQGMHLLTYSRDGTLLLFNDFSEVWMVPAGGGEVTKLPVPPDVGAALGATW